MSNEEPSLDAQENMTKKRTQQKVFLMTFSHTYRPSHRFSHNQRSFLMKQRGTNIETQIQLENVQRIIDLGTISPKWDVFIESPNLWFSEPSRRGSKRE